MNKKFYTSDLHLGHVNALTFDGRPFKDVTEMGEEILRRWNEKVDSGDTVYLLGDICWRNSEENISILKRLNGQKHLVVGNHERLNKDIEKYFVSISDYKEIKDEGRCVVLSHYPIHSFKNHYYKNNYALYGHVHASVEYMVVKKLRKIMENNGFPCEMYNVGIMLHNYEPVTLDEILAKGVI